jgi:hypothetical protein
LEITVKINVPDGPTCYYEKGLEKGLVCGWSMRHTGSGQRWCRIFGDARLDRSGAKCAECLKRVKEEGGVNEWTVKSARS